MSFDKFLTLNNEIKMPAIGLGTWMITDQMELENTINEALETGYRMIDTAPNYKNEHLIGNVLKKWFEEEKIQRDDIFIITKLPSTGNRPQSVEKYLRKSLRDLQLSYVDLYLIQTPFGMPETEDLDFMYHENGDILLDDVDHVAIWKKMEEICKMGLSKSIGISNFNINQIQRIIDNCEIPPANLQVELHVYLQQNELMDYCQQHNIIVTAHTPLGNKNIENLYKAVGINKEIQNLMEDIEVVRIANLKNKSPAQILLRWIIEREIAAIPKTKNPDRIHENFSIFDFNLDDDDMEALLKLDYGIRAHDFTFLTGIEKHPEYPF